MSHFNISNDTLEEKRRWQRIAPYVFSAPLFSALQCERILQAIEDHGSLLNGENGKPNSMQDCGIVVKDEDISKWAGALIDKELNNLVINSFDCLPHHEFRLNHAFLTKYGDEGNANLDLHVDASHLTLNVCLHNDAQGAEIVFTGNRCRSHVDDVSDYPSAHFKFERGDALLHLGNQRHFVTEIESGYRKNLVIWYRLNKESLDHTNSWIQAECPACKHST